MRRSVLVGLLAAASACHEVPRPRAQPNAAVTAPSAGVPALDVLGPPAPAASAAGTLAPPPATQPTETTPTEATAAEGPPPATQPLGTRIDMSGQAMGTRLTFAAYVDATHDEAAIRRALEAAYLEVVRLEGLMTPWRDTSELSRVNAAAGKAKVAVGPEMLEVIQKSLWVGKASGGVFDVTFASMGKLWRFNHDMDGEVPAAAELARARRRIDYRQVEVDPRASTIFLRRADQKIDFGGIAKGYAVDRAAAVLRAAGLDAFYVQAGGDLFVQGAKPDGSPWRVGVRDPRGPEGSFFARIAVLDHAFSTAGDYERSFFKDGKRYHHIIDPRTGYPASQTRSVTVWAKDAFTADAIDDAVFILGPKRGLALVESIDDCGAVIVDAANKVWISKRLKGLVETFREPTDGP
ncbi:MAG: FAD:protein FMN transferase [Deltaproteobacteria bacterium]|nr:FAD:protein FMN transferase [Deltaproteobacteria bacterium]